MTRLRAVAAALLLLTIVGGVPVALWLWGVSPLRLADLARPDDGSAVLAGLTVAYAAARAVGSIPLMPGGLLVVEAVLVPGLVSSGMTLPGAISAMLIYRLVSWIFISAIGWVVFFFMFRTESQVDPDNPEDELDIPAPLPDDPAPPPVPEEFPAAEPTEIPAADPQPTPDSVPEALVASGANWVFRGRHKPRDRQERTEGGRQGKAPRSRHPGGAPGANAGPRGPRSRSPRDRGPSSTACRSTRPRPARPRLSAARTRSALLD